MSGSQIEDFSVFRVCGKKENRRKRGFRLVTHLAILSADRSEFGRGRKSPISDMPDISDFIR